MPLSWIQIALEGNVNMLWFALSDLLHMQGQDL